MQIAVPLKGECEDDFFGLKQRIGINGRVNSRILVLSHCYCTKFLGQLRFNSDQWSSSHFTISLQLT